jgi:hypothetical protein
LVIKDVAALDDQLDPRFRYSQVPAFSASDRAMIDVLTVTREGRLAVLELKADEDIHLPLQGIAYWARVAWPHARGEFHKFGYFAGRELAPGAPLLDHGGACVARASCDGHMAAVHFPGD